MEVRCPQCLSPFKAPDDEALPAVSCPCCGSTVDLSGGQETVAYPCSAGRRVGRFELLERIGAGAFATVWKARDTELQRTVAVKIPRLDDLGPAEIEMLLREARAAAQLSHPNIVSVHEVGRDANTVFLVTDYVRGVTLADWLTARRPSPHQAARLAAAIAEALDHAHRAGVVHRDLKPSNVILDLEERPHLTDFGLAKWEAGEATMSADGKIIGTPAFMSPEQARGKPSQTDHRSDIYALGAILFELLTGQKPFRGNTAMLLHQVIHSQPPRPRTLNRHVPRDLEVICLKCMEKSPRRRYAAAGEVAEELKRFLRGEPIVARPVGWLGRVGRWGARNPAGAAAGLLLLFAAASLFGWWRFASLKSSRNNAPPAAAAALARQLRITEVMYHPAPRAEGIGEAKERLEFIELQNTGAERLDVTSVRIAGAVRFVFREGRAARLEGGRFVLVVKDRAAFVSRYRSAAPLVAGEFQGELDNSGGYLRLETGKGELIQECRYDDAWYPLTDGVGFSLHILDATADRSCWSVRAGWRPSRLPGGSPGAPDPFGMPEPGAIVINEVMPETKSRTGDWIELRNRTDRPLDLGGWRLSDNAREPKKYRIPAGTAIPAQGYLLLDERTYFGAAGGFSLSVLGEEVALTAGGSDGGLLGYQEVQAYGAVDPEVSLGRHPNSSGETDFVALRAPSPGAANGPPRVGPVVISELMYHPSSGERADEYVELLNITDQPVPLHHPARRELTWRFTEGIQFSFPAGAELPPRGLALVTAADPAEFRLRYAVPRNVTIFGPYSKSLANEGELVTLSAPVLARHGKAIAYQVIDHVRYDDRAPWPKRADGHGASLERAAPGAYGNDARAWRASPAGGTPGATTAPAPAT